MAKEIVKGSGKIEGGTFSRQGDIKLKKPCSANVENYATVKWNHICFFMLLQIRVPTTTSTRSFAKKENFQNPHEGLVQVTTTVES